MSKQGGKREGAGRKPSTKPNKIPVCKKLDGDLVAYLKSYPNATAVLESLIRESNGFCEWQKNRRVREVRSTATASVGTCCGV